jgi:hypothetical protein
MRLPLSVVITFFGASTFATAEQAGKCFALEDSMVQVLDADQYYDLAEKLGDCGEAGQNHAAILMANAKRIETETRVASKSMRRVIVLKNWRETFNCWDDLQIQLVWIWSEGGLMYYHMLFRNDAANEDFLASLADNLPLTGKPLTKETTAKIDDLLKMANARLAQVEAQIKRSGYKPPISMASFAGRLEDAHAALKAQFQYAGDDAATQLLLSRCKDPTELWE